MQLNERPTAGGHLVLLEEPVELKKMQAINVGRDHPKVLGLKMRRVTGPRVARRAYTMLARSLIAV